MECTICLEFITNHDYINCATCIYKFHSSCIEQWNSNKCPVCKGKLENDIILLNKYLERYEKYRQLEAQGYYNTNLFSNIPLPLFSIIANTGACTKIFTLCIPMIGYSIYKCLFNFNV